MPLGTPGTGVGLLYLAKVKDELPHVHAQSGGQDPIFNDTIEKFRATVAGNEQVLASLRNQVKVCPNSNCKKPCAYTLTCCNACGTSLEDVEVSYNDNVFMGFIYGIASGKFPYKISLRNETPDLLCFDDPLALSPCHLNCIPTSTYISDLRYLFSDPERGLLLVESLWEMSASVALQQFWGNPAYKSKILGDAPTPASADDLLELVATGMNFPPSMYQLHLQFILFPMMPFQYAMAKEGLHFHHGRFFPLEWLRKALALGRKVQLTVDDSTEISSIIQKVKDAGVDYNAVHSEMLAKYDQAQRRLATWNEADFECQVINGNVFDSKTETRKSNLDAKSLQAADTKILQNYGRPYDENGKPTGSYYRNAKRPGEVVNFVSNPKRFKMVTAAL